MSEKKSGKKKKDEGVPVDPITRLYKDFAPGGSDEGKWADVHLEVGEEKGDSETFKVHSVVLMARSPVFLTMLSGEKSPEKPLKIALKTNPKGIRLLLVALYTEAVPTEKSDAVALAAAAFRYGCRKVSLQAARLALTPSETADEFFKTLDEAAPSLRSLVILANAPLADEILEHKKVGELSRADVVGFMGNSKSAIDEEKLLPKLENWAKLACKDEDAAKVVQSFKPFVHLGGWDLEKLDPLTEYKILNEEDMTLLMEALDAGDNVKLWKKLQDKGYNINSRNLTLNLKGFTWSSKLRNLINVDDDGVTVRPTQNSCGRYKYIMTDKTIPKVGRFYWELTQSNSGGCYDSVGMCNGEHSTSQRLGQTQESWAIRTYGQHSSQDHYGIMGKGTHSNFFQGWANGNVIGLLFDRQEKTLSVFINKKYMGTPFRNVEGDNLRPALEMCHHGTYVANFEAEIPDYVRKFKVPAKDSDDEPKY